MGRGDGRVHARDRAPSGSVRRGRDSLAIARRVNRATPMWGILPTCRQPSSVPGPIDTRDGRRLPGDRWRSGRAVRGGPARAASSVVPGRRRRRGPVAVVPGHPQPPRLPGQRDRRRPAPARPAPGRQPTRRRLRRGEVTGLQRGSRPVGRVRGHDQLRSTNRSRTTPTPGLAENRARERRVGARLGELPTRRTDAGPDQDGPAGARGSSTHSPAFAGRDECVGVSLFWCIVCDGYESIGRHVAVVGDDEEALGTAVGLRHFTDRVTLVTGRRTEPGQRGRADESPRGAWHHRHPRSRGGPIATRPVGIRSLVVASGGGRRGFPARTVECEMVFVSTPKRPRTELARRLGAQADQAG